MGAGQATGGGLQIPGAAVTTGVRAEDTLSALDKLSQAYKNGIVGVSDLMTVFGKGAAMPAQVNQARDASDAAKANMRVRPLETADRIGDLEAKAQLRPAVTGLKLAEIGTAQKDLQFGEKIRPAKETLVQSELTEKQRAADSLAATGGDRSAAETAAARAARIKAEGEAKLAPGAVANAELEQVIRNTELKLKEKDPYGRQAMLVEALTKMGVDFDLETDSISTLTQKFKEAAREAKRTELDMTRAKTYWEQAPKTTADLRKEVQDSAPVKNLRTVESNFRSIEAAVSNPTGVGNVQVLYSYVKALDPGSVVKEGEIGLMQKAMPLYDSLLTRVQGLKTGERLSPEVAQNMLESARQLRDIAKESAAASLVPIQEQIRQQGLDPKQIFGPAEMSLLESVTKTPPEGAPSAPQAPKKPSEAAALPPGQRVVVHKQTGQRIVVDAQNRFVAPAP